MNKLVFFIAVLLLAAGCASRSVSNFSPLPQQPVGQPRSASTSPPAAARPSVIFTVGQVSRHAQKYLHQPVAVAGFLLADFPGYIIISDEAGGAIGPYDLPVSGESLSTLKSGTKYVFLGVLQNGGLQAANHNPVHLQLTAPPEKY